MYIATSMPDMHAYMYMYSEYMYTVTSTFKFNCVYIYRCAIKLKLVNSCKARYVLLKIKKCLYLLRMGVPWNQQKMETINFIQINNVDNNNIVCVIV